MRREICGSCDSLIDDDGTCDCDPTYVNDATLLRQALEAFESMYGRRPERVEQVVSALRERLGEKT